MKTRPATTRCKTAPLITAAYVWHFKVHDSNVGTVRFIRVGVEGGEMYLRKLAGKMRRWSQRNEKQIIPSHRHSKLHSLRCVHSDWAIRSGSILVSGWWNLALFVE